MAKETECLIVKAKMKEHIKEKYKDVNISGEFADALSKRAESIIKEAVARAKANGRKTVQDRDL